MRIVVAITGASGVILGKRLVEFLKSDVNKDKYTVHLIVSEAAKRIAGYENVDLEDVCGRADHFHNEDDIDASIASSSCPVDALAVIPCSMKTLAAIAGGFSDNLVTRSAENVQKTGRRLVIVPRDTPYSLAALDNMKTLKKAGALIVPPVMAYYYDPKTIDDATNFFVGKVLDCLGIEHELYPRWRGER